MATPLSVSMKVCLNRHDCGCTNEEGYCDLTELHSFTGCCTMHMQWEVYNIIWLHTWSHQDKSGGDAWAYIFS